jgi:predicted outer membrane protein
MKNITRALTGAAALALLLAAPVAAQAESEAAEAVSSEEVQR